MPSTHNHNDLYYTETEINSLLERKSGTITSLGQVTITSQYCYKRNNIIYFNISIKATAKIGSWVGFLGFPQGFIPTNNSTPISGTFSGPSRWDSFSGNVMSDGHIQIPNEININETLNIYGMFLI